MLLEWCLTLLVGWVVWYRHNGARFRELASKFPGPRAYPVVGNALQFGKTTSDIFRDALKMSEEYGYLGDTGTAMRLWLGPTLHILVSSPQDIERILSSNSVIDKGFQYKFLLPWLGTGLLTSTGTKWKQHRKILTPTFHFKILEEFVDVFNTSGLVLVDKLRRQVDGPGFNIYNYITLCTLDIICETAMGVKIDAQNDRDSAYVKAIRNMTEIVMKRALKPWLVPDFLFRFSSYKKIQDDSLKVLHDVTNGVIKSRRQEMLRQKRDGDAAAVADVAEDGVKKRLAFLDLLLESTLNGSQLSDQDIREEVDTFMFEGHDTTSSGISFALWLLSWHQDVQERLLQELQDIFPDSEEPVTFRGLQELKYMEQVIKETLRMYPSVPIYSRTVYEELELSNGLVAPIGSTINVVPWIAHRNAVIWPDALKFDPDRFSPYNVQGRHPYAFVPFSAGPRNCIGQKFAFLEIKSTLAHVVRNFKLIPGSQEPDLVLAAELILVSDTGVKVKLVARK